jgi:hypothetical protein
VHSVGSRWTSRPEPVNNRVHDTNGTLTHLKLEDPTSRSRSVIPLNRENTRIIDRRGGTVLHTSRTVIGGDDTFSYAAKLNELGSLPS